MFGLTWVVSALLHKNPPYHPIRDATAISGISSIPNALVVAPSVPAKSVQEFIELAKSRPGQLNFASVGVGSSSHIAAEIFVHAAGIKVVHVPFKTLSGVFSEMASNQIHFYVFTVPSTLAVLGERKFRALAVTSKKRSAALPDVPTFSEVGLPAAEFDNWSGLIAPAKMPLKLVKKINADVRRILQDPSMASSLAARGAVPSEYVTSESFSDLLKSEYARYKKLIPEIGIEPS